MKMSSFLERKITTKLTEGLGLPLSKTSEGIKNLLKLQSGIVVIPPKKDVDLNMNVPE
jgi:hypothetical protein